MTEFGPPVVPGQRAAQDEPFRRYQPGQYPPPPQGSTGYQPRAGGPYVAPEFGTTYQPKKSKRRFSNGTIAGIITIALLVLLGIGGLVATVLWDRVGPDTGVAACEAVANPQKGGLIRSDGAEKMSEREYREVRNLFASSRDKDIKTHGTALIDMAWQIQNIKEEDQLGAAFAYLGPITAAYTGLSGACAKHGHVLPPMGS
jgi:hypothetical protein